MIARIRFGAPRGIAALPLRRSCAFLPETVGGALRMIGGSTGSGSGSGSHGLLRLGSSGSSGSSGILAGIHVLAVLVEETLLAVGTLSTGERRARRDA